MSLSKKFFQKDNNNKQEQKTTFCKQQLTVSRRTEYYDVAQQSAR
jgi:hypothetical protein